jgi:hypothetical protein
MAQSLEFSLLEFFSLYRLYDFGGVCYTALEGVPGWPWNLIDKPVQVYDR